MPLLGIGPKLLNVMECFYIMKTAQTINRDCLAVKRFHMEKLVFILYFYTLFILLQKTLIVVAY